MNWSQLRLAVPILATFCTPLSIFPEPVARIAAWLPPLLALASLCAAPLLLRTRPFLAVIVGWLAVAIFLGWMRADAMRSLSHFTNAAIGLLWFAVIVWWTDSLPRLRLALWLSALAFASIVVVGYAMINAESTSGPKFLPWASPEREIQFTLPGMRDRSVNRNVVGALAVAAIPLLLAAGLEPIRASRWRAVRYLPWMAVPIFIAVAAVSQSVSVYGAAAVVLLAAFLGQRAGRWRVRLATAAILFGLVALVPAMFKLALPSADRSILQEMTPDGVALTVTDGERGPDGAPAVAVSEMPSRGLHELRKVISFPAGPIAMTAVVRPMGAAGVHLYGGSYARLDLKTREVDDLGGQVAWVQPLGGGWLAVRNVTLLTTQGDVHVGVRLLNQFPTGEEYAGDPGRGITVSGVYMQPAAGVSEYLAMTRILFMASVRRAFAARQEVWEEAASLVKANALWGVGLDMARHQLSALGGGGVHAHNFALQTTLDLGIAGALAVLALLLLLTKSMVIVWRDGMSNSSRIGWYAGLAVLAFQVFGLFDAIALGTKVGLLFWLAAGLLVAACHLSAAERSAVTYSAR